MYVIKLINLKKMKKIKRKQQVSNPLAISTNRLWSRNNDDNMYQQTPQTKRTLVTNQFNKVLSDKANPLSLRFNSLSLSKTKFEQK